MASDQLRIALTVDRFATGRPRELHVERLARELAAAGNHVVVLTHDRGDGLPEYEFLDGLTVHRFPRVLAGGRRTIAGSLPRHLVHSTRGGRLGYDIVHVHGGGDSPAALAAALWTGPLVLTPMGHGRGGVSGPLRRARRLIHSRVVARADRIVCTSGADADALIRYEPAAIERIDVIPPGVDVDQLRSAPMSPEADGRRILLSAGRLDDRARTDRLLIAMTGLRKDFVLKVLGDGPNLSHLSGLVRLHGLENDVHLIGRVPDGARASLLRTASCLVSASTTERADITVLEALAASTRVLVTATAAHVDIGRRVDGCVSLIPVDAQPHTIADAVRNVCREPRPDVFVLSWVEVALQTSMLYHRILHAPGDRSRSSAAPGRRSGARAAMRRLVG